MYYPGQIALPDGASPPVLNKSFSVIADIEIPEAGAEGMIFTHGGLTGGYGIYLRDGKATFRLQHARHRAVHDRVGALARRERWPWR